MLKFLRVLLPMILLLVAASAHAGSDGQDDLDKAIDTKLNARTISDLGEVISLTESALKKGLDKDNVGFANKLLSSTLVQRGQETFRQIMMGVRSPDDLRQKRQFALSDLERAVQLDAKLGEAHLLIAQLNLLRGGDAKKAREEIDKALDVGLDEPATRAKALMLRAGLQETPEKKLADLDEAVRRAAQRPQPTTPPGPAAGRHGKDRFGPGRFEQGHRTRSQGHVDVRGQGDRAGTVEEI